MNPRTLVQCLTALAAWLPLKKVLAVLKAALPLPATREELPGWLNRVGILDPLAAAILAAAARRQPATWTVCPGEFCTEYTWVSAVEDECVRAGIDRATLDAISQIGRLLWQFLQSPKKS